MISSTQKKGYLGYFIAGGLVTAGGGSILAMGIVYAWLGNLIQNIGGGTPLPGMGIISALGIGMAIGGGVALIVGLALLSTGVSKKKEYHAGAAPSAISSKSEPVASTGRDYAYNPAPVHGTITGPVIMPKPVPVASHCSACGELLPAGMDAQFCPSCGAPTR